MLAFPPLLPILLASAAVQPLTIYVGPQVKDGFVDIDKGVADSIKDIKTRIPKGLRLVPSESEATLKLFVVSREKYQTGSSSSTNIGSVTKQGLYTGGSYTSGLEKMRVFAVLRVGDYGRKLTGDADRFTECAEAILNDVMTWVEANRSRLAALPPKTP
jgi:hypothetical protein